MQHKQGACLLGRLKSGPGWVDGRKRVLKAHGASVNDSEYTWNVRLYEQFCNSSKYVVFLRIHILVNTPLCEIGYLYDSYHLKITLPS